MKKGNSLIFFPGKGIFTNPDSDLEPIVKVYRKDEAIKIFRQFSQALVCGGDFVSAQVNELIKVHGKIIVEEKKYKDTSRLNDLNFSNKFTVSDTRVSFGSGNVDWFNLEKFLQKKGFSLIKRENNFIYVYAVVHENFGVIAEGKGFTDEQAKRSALSEAIERCFSSGEEEIDLIIGSKESLLSKNNDLLITAGLRDVYDDNIYTEWVKALDIVKKEKTYLPAESVFFNYTPKKIKLKLFSLSHTTGLAAGASMEDATLSGLFEVIERDCYWIVMRCKMNCPDIDLKKIKDLNPAIISLVSSLAKSGFKIVIKDMSLDWGVPVAHAVLKDNSGSLPTFAHGSGAGCTWAVAITRAVAEVVQMYLGMKEFVNIPDNWEKVISAQGNLGSGVLSWSDPLYEKHIDHLFSKSKSKFKKNLKVDNFESLLNIMKKKNYSVIVAPVYKKCGLHVVRVYIPEATQPDERIERLSKRLLDYKKKLKLKSFYCDPILT